MPGPVTCAADLVELLRAHHLPKLPNGRAPGGVFATEIGSPDGSRRADALWCPLAVNRDNGLVGYEIKVTRSDLLSEIADPTKADPWFQHCTQWFLVVPDPCLIDGMDIPESWGVMSPPSGRCTRTMTVVKPAPKRKVGDASEAWQRALSWYFYRAHRQVLRLENELADAKRTNQNLSNWLEEARKAGAGLSHTERRVTQIVQALEERTGYNAVRDKDEPFTRADDETIIEAILDVARSRRVAQDLRHQVEQAQRALERAVDGLESVGREFAWLREHVPDDRPA